MGEKEENSGCPNISNKKDFHMTKKPPEKIWRSLQCPQIKTIFISLSVILSTLSLLISLRPQILAFDGDVTRHSPHSLPTPLNPSHKQQAENYLDQDEIVARRVEARVTLLETKLEGRVALLENKLSSLHGQGVTSLKSKVTSLKNEVTNLVKDVALLFRAKETSNRDIKALRHLVGDLRTELQRVEKPNSSERQKRQTNQSWWWEGSNRLARQIDNVKDNNKVKPGVLSESGCTCPPGPRGRRGKRGLKGRAGPPGIPGKGGQQGFPGPVGLDGPKGEPGIAGYKGQKGDPGAGSGYEFMTRNEVVSRGYKIPHENEVLVLKGEPGDPGEMGLQGPVGPAGLPGIDGIQGPEGSVGSKGDPGIPGKPGTQGKDGKPGDKGPKGDTGVVSSMSGDLPTAILEGPPGPPGPKGEPGLKGDLGVIGKPGQPGRRGKRGLPGKGELGDKGDIGSKGDKGDMGTLGVDGVPGLKAEKGEPGNPGERGKRGKKGDRGPPGAPGLDAPCPTGPDGLPIPSCGWRTGIQLGPDTDLAIGQTNDIFNKGTEEDYEYEEYDENEHVFGVRKEYAPPDSWTTYTNSKDKDMRNMYTHENSKGGSSGSIGSKSTW